MRVKNYFTFVQARKAMEQWSWPQDRNPGALHANVLVGQEGLRPTQGGTLHYSASQTLYFAEQSVAIFSQFITDKEDPAWLAWQAHVAYNRTLMRTDFTVQLVWELDKQICDATALFNIVPTYTGLNKPKQAFAQHYPMDILNCGSPRNYWCMRFESKNQVCLPLHKLSAKLLLLLPNYQPTPPTIHQTISISAKLSASLLKLSAKLLLCTH